MPTRPCIDCGTLARSTRCPTCQSTLDAARNARRTHYQGDWPKRSKAAIAAQPWCHTLGGCPHSDADTAANPLTADHVIPVAQGGADGPLTVLCRRCNASKGSR